MTNPTLSIVIVSYNVKEYLLSCLRSINDSSQNISSEIIVVDNASSDGSMEMVKKSFPAVNVIQNNCNAGFSKANNQGIQMATGKFILLLNPDTELKIDALEKLISFAEKQKGNFIAGPKLLNPDGSLQSSAWKYPNLLSLIAETFYLHTVFTCIGYSSSWYSKERQCEWLSGVALLFRRNGDFLFDETLFWMDDVDFCYEAAKKGTPIIYHPLAEIMHHGGKSSADNFKMVIPNQVVSKLKFWKKYKNYFFFLVACIVTIVFILSRIIVLLFLAPFGNNFQQKLIAYFYAMKKYFRYCFLSDKSIS